MTDFIIAVDLGATNIRTARGTPDGKLIQRMVVPTIAAEGPDRVVPRIVQAIRAVADDFKIVRGIGLCAPGPTDPWKGIVFQGANLPGWHEIPLKEKLEREFHVPAFCGNDANVAALGEQRYGAGRGAQHMIYLTISTGIGGGIIADGKLFLGSRGFAGEVGHQTIDVNGPLCNCGNIGCVEALAAGPAIERDAREAIRAGRESRIRALVGGEVQAITGAVIAQAAREGDAFALELYQRAGFYIGLALVNLLHDFDTQLFVVGGGVAIHVWDFLYPAMRATLDKHAFTSMSKGVRIIPAELGDDAGLLGSLALVIDETSPLTD
jgi:glucokinase